MDDWHLLYLEMLGGLIEVRLSSARCRDDIADYYRSHVVVDPWRSPDAIVTCTWPEAARELFRDRPEHMPSRLDGVTVHVPGRDPMTWDDRGLPLPPLSHYPFAGRFVGLHAAAVVSPEGIGITIAGASGSGKTTLSLLAASRLGHALMTDETLLVHLRSTVAEGLVRPVGVTDGPGLPKRLVSAQSAATVFRGPHALHAVLFLERIASGPSNLQPIDGDSSFGRMLRLHYNVGSSSDQAMVSLAILARRLPAWRYRYSSIQHLVRDSGDLLERVYGGAAREPR